MSTTRWLPVRLLEDRRARTDQRGFALIAVLAIIGLFSLLIVAVLSQTTVAMNVTANQRVYVATNRAADGAIEAATNELLRQTSAQLEDQDDPCAPLRPDTDDYYEVEVDGRPVRVYCEVPPPADGGEFETLIPATTGEVGRTMLVGAGSASRGLPSASPALARWSTTCGTTQPRANASSRAWQADCFPWADSLDALWASSGYGQSYMQGVVNSLNPSLAHSAPETLKFGGDVDVRGAVAASLNPASMSGPAINVAGEYRQGAEGAVSIAHSQPGNCRYLSPTWGTHGAPEVWVQSQPDVAINDVSGNPACGNTDAAALRDEPGSGTNVALPQPAPWSISTIAARSTAAPSCTSPTTEVRDGAYLPAAVTALNTLIATCNATIWFRPGDYWFGGDLNIANANARVVFGARHNWQSNAPTTPAHFQQADATSACDPDDDGVSISLRESATITHTNGRVAICNRTNGVDTAIQQNASGPSEWIPGLSAAAKITESDGTTGDWAGIGGRGGSWSTAPGPTNLADIGGGAAAWSNNCSASWLVIINCNAKAGVLATVQTGAPSPDRPIDSFTVRTVAQTNDLLTGWDFLGSAHINLNNAIEGGSIAGVRIRARQAGSSTWCTRSYQGLPNWGGSDRVPLAYDLLASSDVTAEQQQVENCWRPNFATQAHLEGAQVRVDFLFRARYVDLNPFNFGSTRNVTLNLDQLQVQAGWGADATTASDGGAGVLSRQGGSIGTSVRCRTTSCPTAEGNDITFTIANFSGSNAPLPSATTLDRVVFEITGRNAQASDPGNAFTRAVVSVPGKGSCQVQVPHIPSFGQTFQIDLAAGTGGTCASVLQDPLDVMNASVSVRAHLDCYEPAFARGCFRFLGFGVGSISANIDHARLVAFTSSTNPLRPARVTSNATTSGGGASFYVDGDVSLTRRNLEVAWSGPAQEASMFNGDLILNGLSSVATTGTAEVGVVCCAEVRPTARNVMLSAVFGTVDPEVVSRALVSISDVDSTGTIVAGRDVTVREFSVCRVEPVALTPAGVMAADCRTNVRP